MSLKNISENLDALFVFPRPANEQYLSSYKMLLRVLKDGSSVTVSFILALTSTFITLYTLDYALTTFKLTFLAGLGVLLTLFSLLLFFFIWMMFLGDFSGIFLPYRTAFQRESHGGSVWASVRDLQKEETDAVRRAGEDTEGKGVVIAPFKHYISLNPQPKYNIFLSLRQMANSLIIWGPPGSGKSSTFFMHAIRQFASCGGAIILDVKGELYNYTAHYFSNVYRLDIMNPINTDWFDLFSECYRNPDLALRIAAYMVGEDANKQSSQDPIWNQSATSMLAVMILYLCEKMEHPTPRDILRFLSENQIKSRRYDPISEKNVTYSPLNEAFDKCTYFFAKQIWNNNFAKMPEDTFGSVKFNADTAIRQLLSPKANEILRPPTEAERKMGRRRIDFTQLRKMFDFEGKIKRGTAVYIVVSPSDAMNMPVFLRVIFSVALDTLREKAKSGTSVLIALDEAGNVPLSKLPEGINTDRSVNICYFLGYQTRNQPNSQYGKDAAGTFCETAGTNIFLSGCDDETAKMASDRMGDTTILQRSSSDAKNDGFDQEKVSETGRKLMMPQELTRLKRFTQCVVMIKGAPPIRTKVPGDAKMMDVRVTTPDRVVDQVSEEVARTLGLLTGRVTEAKAKTVVDQNTPTRRQIVAQLEAENPELNTDPATINAPAQPESAATAEPMIDEQENETDAVVSASAEAEPSGDYAFLDEDFNDEFPDDFSDDSAENMLLEEPAMVGETSLFSVDDNSADETDPLEVKLSIPENRRSNKSNMADDFEPQYSTVDPEFQVTRRDNL